MQKLIAIFFALAVLLPLSAQAQTAREIMEMVNKRDDGDNRTSDMEMVLIDKNEQTRSRAIRTFNKDKITDAGQEDRQQLMFFLSPADVKDTGFLTYDYEENAKDDDQWLYLPALRKTKRIASTDKSGSFMGSDFNYSDMTRRNLDAYDYELMKEDEVRGAKVWVIKSTPKTREEADNSGYKQGIVFVHQEAKIVVRAVMWTTTGSKIKYLDMPGLEQIDGIWTPTHMTMKTTKNKVTEHRTELMFKNIQYGQNLDQDMFTVRQLEKGL